MDYIKLSNHNSLFSNGTTNGIINKNQINYH